MFLQRSVTPGPVGQRHTDPWSYWLDSLAASVGSRFHEKPYLKNKVKSNEKNTHWSRKENTELEMVNASWSMQEHPRPVPIGAHWI